MRRAAGWVASARDAVRIAEAKLSEAQQHGAQVYGFSWKKAPSISDTMTPKFVALEALAVFLHLAVFCGLSLGPIFYALAMQVPSERPRVACAAVV